jgi:Ca2+-binding EF-hand superfamily protein
MQLTAIVRNVVLEVDQHKQNMSFLRMDIDELDKRFRQLAAVTGMIDKENIEKYKQHAEDVQKLKLAHEMMLALRHTDNSLDFLTEAAKRHSQPIPGYKPYQERKEDM